MRTAGLDERLRGASGVAWSAQVLDVDNDAVLWQYEPEQVLATASVGKVFLLIEVARQIEAGDLEPGEPLTRSDEDHVADSGLWHLFRTPTVSVADACVLVGSVSDNLATNVLLRRVGLEAVARTARACGCRDSGLLDRVREPRLPEHPPALSVGTATELARLMAGLHRGDVVSREVSDRVLGWLAAGADLSMVAGALGLDPLAHEDADRGVLLRHKTGTVPTARIDVGVVEGPTAVVAYGVVAEWETAADPRDAVLATMGEIGSRIAGHVRGDAT